MTGTSSKYTLRSLACVALLFGCDAATKDGKGEPAANVQVDAQKAAAQNMAAGEAGNAKIAADGTVTANGVTVNSIGVDGKTAVVTDANGRRIEADASGAGKAKVGDLEADGAEGGSVKAPGIEVDGAGGGHVKAGGVEVDGNTGKVTVNGVEIDPSKVPGASAHASGGAKAGASGGKCDVGNCKQVCRSGGDFTCDGGNCTQTAEAGTCNLSCRGGNCTQTCKAGATCDMSCDGGTCTRSGAGKKSCKGSGCTG